MLMQRETITGTRDGRCVGRGEEWPSLKKSGGVSAHGRGLGMVGDASRRLTMLLLWRLAKPGVTLFLFTSRILHGIPAESSPCDLLSVLPATSNINSLGLPNITTPI